MRFGLINKNVVAFLGIAFLMNMASASNADIIITYGNGSNIIDLLPNTAGQDVQFFASGVPGEGNIDGLELNMQIGDGGTAIGGTDIGPTFEAVDMVLGTIWNGPGGGANQDDPFVSPLLRQSTVFSNSAFSADGLVATITFDTTGFSNGTFDFLLSGVAGNFDSVFFLVDDTVPTTAPNGFLRIGPVPEPSSATLLVGLAGLIWVRRRK